MIHIFTTGGTIEGLDYVDDKNSKSQPITTIDSFLKSSNISIDYTIENVFQKDSRHINDADRKLLLDKIEASNSQKILITHGTFTMEHTARFLGQMQLGKTIVLVTYRVLLVVILVVFFSRIKCSGCLDLGGDVFFEWFIFLQFLQGLSGCSGLFFIQSVDA